MMFYSVLLAAIVVQVNSQSSQITLTMNPCRFIVSNNYQLQVCEERDVCTRETISSKVRCNRWGYKQIVDIQECIQTCCFELDPQPSTLTPDLVRKCYQQYQIRYAVYIISIVGGTVGGALILVGLVCIRLFWFVRNPYTGKRVFVGGLCCKKNIDFEEDYRRQMGSEDKVKEESKKSVMDVYQRSRPNVIIE